MSSPARIAASLVTTRNKLELRGVSAEKGRYAAAIGKGGSRRFLGYFPTAIDAARAYDKAARKLYGPLAALNFPQAGERGVRHVDDPVCVHGHDLSRFGVWTTNRRTPVCKECWRLGRARLRAKARDAG